MEKRYRARCDTHDWEGQTHEEREDAVEDLDAHITQEDGDHDGEILEFEV